MNGHTDKSITKASIGYTLGNYLLKGIGLISLPIFSRLLTTEDFGIYNTFLAYESIVYIFIGLALHSSLKNAFLKYGEKIDEYCSSVELLPMAVFIVFFVTSLMFKDQIGRFVHLEGKTVPYLVVYSYCSGLLIFYSSRLALEYRYMDYIRISMFNAIANVMLSLILILFLTKERYFARIAGGTIAYVLVGIFILFRLFKVSPPRINREYWRYGLRISLPIIPHGLSQILLLQFDRIMINAIIGSKEAGLYSFSYSIYSIAQITANSLDTVFSTWVYENYGEDDNSREKVSIAGTCIVVILAGIITGMMLLSPEIIMILGGSKYKDTVYSLLPVLLGGFFSLAYCVPSVLEYYYEKTKYVALGTTFAAVLNIILNWIFIPRYGYIAAAYTTLFCYMLYFLLHRYLSKRLGGFYMIKNKYLLAVTAILIFAFLAANLFLKELFMRILLLIIVMFLEFFLAKKLIDKGIQYGIQFKSSEVKK